MISVHDNLNNISEMGECVRTILTVSDDMSSYETAKLAVDRLIDPSFNEEGVREELDRLVNQVYHMAGVGASDETKLNALRRVIYSGGPWNDHRPFSYDQGNIRGVDVRVKLIANYLNTRRGDCVSMPVLLLILAERLGIEMALVSAPNHLFLRYTCTAGRVVNLEATSGANPMRDAWIRHVRPMSDRAVASGLYLRTLSKGEGIALIATTVLQYLMDARRYEDAISVAEVILARHSRDGLTLANLGNACERILRRDFLDRYGSQFLIPQHLRPGYHALMARNRAAFARAFALGWEPDAG